LMTFFFCLVLPARLTTRTFLTEAEPLNISNKIWLNYQETAKLLSQHYHVL